eukprot:CAMPEP_0197044180 /NCGR_PEP_ID=MMETSP1384-20130603/20290_1 /TAXON_ID=29189 /ORGANISM="Ammonia sp." /LENGTH=576 /DNA_ID=CAMNT_0042475593 /DNA_START=27 /DNA_END=1757 /DNA_ORIENTATION=-
MAHRGPIGINALSAAILFAPTPSSAADYTARASLGQTSCSGAGVNDRCLFYCDQEYDSKTSFVDTFNCGTVTECQFHCQASSCFTSATLNAQFASHLELTSTAASCTHQATINVPNTGNATLSTSVDQGFKERMVVNAGTNTQSIIINCVGPSANDCKRMEVNADTAQYLEINVGATSGFVGGAKDATTGNTDKYSTVVCPSLGAFAASSQSAPCVFDASSGGSLENLYITTQYGYPRDVAISSTDYKEVYVECTALDDGKGSDKWPVDPTDSKVNCYYTHDPTTSPTRGPTQSPTTSSPTSSPSANPSGSPTRSPSRIPTKNPTASPSKVPSASPSGSPSASPSTTPSISPSVSPSHFPSQSPTASPMITTVDENGDQDEQAASAAGAATINTVLIAGVVLGLTFLLFLCIVCAYKYWIREKEAETDADKVVIRIQSSPEDAANRRNSRMASINISHTSSAKQTEMFVQEAKRGSISNVNRVQSGSLTAPRQILNNGLMVGTQAIVGQQMQYGFGQLDEAQVGSEEDEEKEMEFVRQITPQMDSRDAYYDEEKEAEYTPEDKEDDDVLFGMTTGH